MDRAAGRPAVHSPTLPVAAVARRLGVAPSTLRTWDRRYGLGPSGHTDGRHRRYGPADVGRLELMQRALLRGASTAEAARFALQRLPRGEDDEPATARPDRALDEDQAEEPAHPAHTLTGRTARRIEVADGELVLSAAQRYGADVPRQREPAAASRIARALSAASLAMDVRAVQRLLAEAIAAQGVLPAWREVIEPVLAALGARWRIERSGAESEYLLAECVFAAFARATPVPVEPRNERPILLGCAPGEGETLPMYALTAALAGRRMLTQLFGVPLPPAVLAAAVGRSMPAAVVLWARDRTDADADMFHRLVRSKQRCRWFACGPGWRREHLPATVELLDDLPAAVERLEFVLFGRRGPGPMPPRPE